VREDAVLKVIRSRNGATVDDIIVGTHFSSKTVSQELGKLTSRGVIEQEAGMFYLRGAKTSLPPPPPAPPSPP
jgi:DeoR/GlpR family transcriptional regulator of sugar metabolism